ncbi:MAG: T9SS type A sorting domain-containing protein [bacterium]
MFKGSRASGVIPGLLCLLLVAGAAGAGVDLVRPHVEVREGDRIVDLWWQDPEPEKLTFVGEPRLGTVQYAWRGKAAPTVTGFYTGACDWTYNAIVLSSASAVTLSWSKITDWSTKATKDTQMVLGDTDVYYDFSDGIRIAVPSAGLFRIASAGWTGPVPEFHGIYRGGTAADTAVTYDFLCTAGGDLSPVASGGVVLGWTNSLGESGSLSVPQADQSLEIDKGLKAIFPAGRYEAGERFSADARVPFGKADAARGLPSDAFKIPAYTFEGYLVLRRSVEDRAGSSSGASFKVIANKGRCQEPEFFEDGDGNPAPYGRRSFQDLGIPGGTEGSAPNDTVAVILNGFPYKYAVLTYDMTSTYDLLTCDTTWTEVYPAVSDSGKTVHDVRVVPNPYVFRAGWEQDERKIQFVNVPEGAVIDIYDASGGHVRTVRPNNRLGGQQAGTADWNLEDSDREPVVSGIYIYRIEAKGNTKTGRFIVVK